MSENGNWLRKDASAYCSVHDETGHREPPESLGWCGGYVMNLWFTKVSRGHLGKGRGKVVLQSNSHRSVPSDY